MDGRTVCQGLGPVVEWHALSPAQREDASEGMFPVVLRGYVADWPLVQKAASSFGELESYLRRFDSGRVFQAMIAPPEVQGRLFYGPDLRSFNFERMNGYLPEAMDIFSGIKDMSTGPSFYIGSTCVPEYLCGLEAENPLDLVDADPNIWIGTAVTVATHSDNYENIACVAAGRRRFTLFPPEQEENLYIGPKDVTPAGRAVSLVDLRKPDFGRYPKFETALKSAQVAVLEAGDAIYIPTNWWHNVESLEPFNILMNYWWKGSPPPLKKIA
jgi:hypothetical protein